MTSASHKRLVVSSLKSLHKRKMDKQFRVRAIRQARRVLNEEERALAKHVKNLDDKIHWEIDTHADILRDLGA